MNRLVRISIVLAVLAVIAVGSLAFAKEKPIYHYCNKPFECPLFYDPVLCADGVVYNNLCYADRVCAPLPCRELGGEPI